MGLFKRKKRFCTIPMQMPVICFTSFFGKSKPGESYCDWCFRMPTDAKNHSSGTPLEGGSPNIWVKEETRDEDNMNLSDPAWGFQLCCEKPLALKQL